MLLSVISFFINFEGWKVLGAKVTWGSSSVAETIWIPWADNKVSILTFLSCVCVPLSLSLSLSLSVSLPLSLSLSLSCPLCAATYNLFIFLSSFRNSSATHRAKIDAFVDFPIDGLDLAPYCRYFVRSNLATLFSFSYLLYSFLCM